MDSKTALETDEVITRAELARRAQAKGLDVTERTIRYWAGKDLIPRPVRLPGQGPRAFYPASLLDLIGAMVALRPANIRLLREQLHEVQPDLAAQTAESHSLDVGGQQFEVLPAPVCWSGRDFNYQLFALADSSGNLLLLKKMPPETEAGRAMTEGEIEDETKSEIDKMEVN